VFILTSESASAAFFFLHQKQLKKEAFGHSSVYTEKQLYRESL